MTASPQLDEASPLQPPSPRRPSGGLTFRAPESEWPAGEIRPDLTAEQYANGESLTSPGAGSPSASDELHELSDEGPDSDPTSSRASSADPGSVRPLTAKAQKLAARQAVKIAGSMAHQYLARDEAAKAVGLYLVDDEVAEQIGDPLSRIMARHSPADGAMANPDVADGIAAMLGVANFVRITIEKSSAAAAVRVQQSGDLGAVDV
jgi:hypothetical protein